MSAPARRRLPVPGVLVALLLALLLPSTLGAAMLSDKNALLCSAACAYAIAAVSLNILMGYAGQISLGQFAFVGVGAFTTGIVTGVDQLRLPWTVGLLAACRRRRSDRLPRRPSRAEAAGPLPRRRDRQRRVRRLAGAVPRRRDRRRLGRQGDAAAVRRLVRDRERRRLPHHRGRCCLVLVWQLDVNLTRSRIGRAFQAVKADEAVAASFGVDVARYKLLAFTLSGAGRRHRRLGLRHGLRHRHRRDLQLRALAAAGRHRRHRRARQSAGAS
jgi:branched-chain amino acid transport system permease protein